MLSGYWKNKLEEEKYLESLQNLYKNEVMKYKLSKAAGEQYYSIFKPITEKLEDVAEHITRLKELSEERMLPPPVVPAAIADGRLAELEDDEFEEAPEVKHKGPEWKFRPDENVSEETLEIFNLKPPSIMKDRPMEEIKKYLKSQKENLTRDINKIKIDGGDSSLLEKMQNIRQELDNYTDIISLDKLKVGEGAGRRLYKMNQYGQYGSSYIGIPLLKKRRILLVKDGRGNPLLNGKISKDFVDLITKRFNS